MTEAQAEVFTRILELYRWQLFAEIRQNGQTISDMMVARYEKHKADLKRLKKWIRTYRKDEYVTLFRDDNDPSGYAAYTHHLTSPARFQQEKFTRCRQEGAKIKSIPEGFYNKCRRILESKKIDLPENARAEANEMLEEMKADNVFLPLQRINLKSNPEPDSGGRTGENSRCAGQVLSDAAGKSGENPQHLHVPSAVLCRPAVSR